MQLHQRRSLGNINCQDDLSAHQRLITAGVGGTKRPGHRPSGSTLNLAVLRHYGFESSPWPFSHVVPSLSPILPVSLCLMKQTWTKTAAWRGVKRWFSVPRALFKNRNKLSARSLDSYRGLHVQAHTYTNTRKTVENHLFMPQQVSVSKSVAHLSTVCYRVCLKAWTLLFFFSSADTMWWQTF